jgi:hypothetical protein
MSLQALSELRRNRQRPAGIVKVVVGKPPHLDDRVAVIVVTPTDRPAFMDWRPLVGLPIALFTADGHEVLGTQTLDALQAASVHLVGSAWRETTLSLDEAHKPVLHRMWELLCQ